MTGWWNGRSPRERLLLLTLLGATMLLALVQLVWLPLERARGGAERARDTARQTLALVQSAAATAGRQAKAVPRVTADPRGDLIRTAREANLTITRLEPGPDGLSVWMDGVPAADLHRWLGILSAAHGLDVRRASVRAGADGATVRAQLLFAVGDGR